MNLRAGRYWIGRLDWIMALTTAALVAVGVAFIFSAGWRGPDEPGGDFYRKQLFWAGLGALVFIGAAVSDYRRIGAQAIWIYLLALAGLVLVLAVGREMYGARRWIRLFGVNIQPSEFAKLATVLATARYLSLPDTDPRRFATMIWSGLITGGAFLLIVVEPDLGTAMTLLPTLWVLWLVAGVPPRTLALIVLSGVLLMPVAWLGMGEYQRERVRVFLDAERDPQGAGWNKIQSAIAVGSGGFAGKGYLKGTQNVLGFLPRTVAPTDFIFSVIAEEKGFTGSLTLLGLFAVWLGGGIRAAARARDKFGQLLAAGLTTLLFAHVFVNIAMTIGLLPITGLPLPLISYGGSFMLTTMLALGLMQSVYVRRHTAD